MKDGKLHGIGIATNYENKQYLRKYKDNKQISSEELYI